MAEFDEYTRERVDRIAEDSAVTRAAVGRIEQSLERGEQRFVGHDERLGRLERGQTRVRAVGGMLAFLAGAAIGWLRFFKGGGS